MDGLIDAEDTDGTSLARRIGRLLRTERERASLTQEALAYRAGASQQCVSRFETGVTAPTTTMVDRLFAALGQQVRLDLEPLNADLDDQIARAKNSDGALVAVMLHDLRFLLRKTPDLRYLIDGELAAALHGVPIRPSRYDLAVADRDLDEFADWLCSLPNCLRFSERWRDYRGYDIDPRHAGPLRWRTPFGELCARLLPELPAGVPVCVDGWEVPVRPLFDVERDEPQIARILARVRSAERGG
jgi:transcriptional regulator with XRE-family HTH domain